MRMSQSDFEGYQEEGAGYCTFCKDITECSGIEPDTVECACSECLRDTVVGMDIALDEGFVSLDGDEEE